jgi:hypothetical protein
MNDAIETKDIGKYRIEIFYDTSPDSPRNWDNMGTMVCFHNRYTLGDKNHGYDTDDYEGWEGMKVAIEKNENAAIILPIFMYDHSGITIATKPFGCRWDSGQIGFIFISKEKIRKEFNIKRVTKKWLEKVATYLDGEVETYDQFLRGDVYGYEIHEIKTCELGHEHLEDMDSCWGFYGQDTCMEEAESIVKHYLD